MDVVKINTAMDSIVTWQVRSYTKLAQIFLIPATINSSFFFLQWNDQCFPSRGTGTLEVSKDSAQGSIPDKKSETKSYYKLFKYSVCRVDFR